MRDKDSGLVSAVVHLRPELDYDIDYLQGRILLSEPLASTVDDELLVRSEGLSGNEVWLVVQYEYTPGFDEIDTLAAGGQGQYWLNDFVKLGVTANRNDEGDSDSSLYGANLTVRKSADSWLKLQAGRSEGLVSSSFRSDDGGFRFLGTEDVGLGDADADAYRADVSLGFADFFDGGRGRLNLYAQRLDAGYSAPGLTTLTDTQQFGGTFGMPLTERMRLAAKADRRVEKDGLETTAQEVDVGYQLTEQLESEHRGPERDREDNSPVVPVTQEEGDAHGRGGAGGLRLEGQVARLRLRTGHAVEDGRPGGQPAHRCRWRLSHQRSTALRRGGLPRRPRTGWQARHELPGVREHAALSQLRAGQRAGGQRPARAQGQPDPRCEDAPVGQRERLPREPLPAHGLDERPDPRHGDEPRADGALEPRRQLGDSAP